MKLPFCHTPFFPSEFSLWSFRACSCSYARHHFSSCTYFSSLLSLCPSFLYLLTWFWLDWKWNNFTLFLEKSNYGTVFLKLKNSWRPLWRSKILSLEGKVCRFGMGSKTALEFHKKIHIKAFICNCLWNQQKYKLWVIVSSPSLLDLFPLFWQNPLVKYFPQSWCFLEFSKLKAVQGLLARAVQFLLWLLLCVAWFLIQIRNCSNRIAVITSLRLLLKLKIL